MQPPKPPKGFGASLRGKPSKVAGSSKTKDKSISALVLELRETEKINQGDLKTLRMKVAGRIRSPDYEEIESLKSLPSNRWGEDVKNEFDKWFDNIKVQDEEPKEVAQSILDQAIDSGNLRIVPQQNNGVQLLFEALGEKRSLMVLGDGVGLEKHPDEFPDVADFTAMLYALGEPSLAAGAKKSLYNYLAFVAQCLNPLPLAKIVGFIAQNQEFLSAKLYRRVSMGLQNHDLQAANLLAQLATTTDLPLGD